mgnify:CR=1 FL=1
MAIKRNDKKTRLKPISLYPLRPEQALSAFMQIDPKRIKVKEKKAQKQRR